MSYEKINFIYPGLSVEEFVKELEETGALECDELNSEWSKDFGGSIRLENHVWAHKIPEAAKSMIMEDFSAEGIMTDDEMDEEIELKQLLTISFSPINPDKNFVISAGYFAKDKSTGSQEEFYPHFGSRESRKWLSEFRFHFKLLDWKLAAA